MEKTDQTPVEDTAGRRVLASSRFVVGVPIVGLFVGAVTLSVMAGVQTALTVMHAITGDLSKSEAVLDFIELADVFLLATVLYIMSLGLFELFIDDRMPLPAWLQIHSLDDLKKKLVGVVAVVLAVSFLGRVIQGGDAMSLLESGVGIAAVVAAMGYFMKSGGH